jgi:hypothetical protein
MSVSDIPARRSAAAIDSTASRKLTGASVEGVSVVTVSAELSGLTTGTLSLQVVKQG